MRRRRLVRAGERLAVRVDGGRIFFRAYGKGPPLVIVHGLLGSSRWWSRNLPALASRFTVLLVEQIAYGSGGLPVASVYLDRWLTYLDIPRARLMGHSMGGYIIADLAAEHPERVERLVLVDSVGIPFEWGYRRHAVNLARSLPQTSLRTLPLGALDALRAGPLKVLLGAREAVGADLRPKLARITAPTLVVWGARDPLVPMAAGQRLAESMPLAMFASLDGAGHVPMWERAEAFNSLVLGFLSAPASAMGLRETGGARQSGRDAESERVPGAQ